MIKNPGGWERERDSERGKERIRKRRREKDTYSHARIRALARPSSSSSSSLTLSLLMSLLLPSWMMFLLLLLPLLLLLLLLLTQRLLRFRRPPPALVQAGAAQQRGAPVLNAIRRRFGGHPCHCVLCKVCIQFFFKNFLKDSPPFQLTEQEYGVSLTRGSAAEDGERRGEREREGRKRKGSVCKYYGLSVKFVFFLFFCVLRLLGGHIDGRGTSGKGRWERNKDKESRSRDKRE
jgi:hypothetical protein